jgi:hypothetical protein
MDDPQLATAVAYVAGNPVTAGLWATPEDWRWSGHGRGVDVHRALLMGGTDGACEHPLS